MINQKKVEYMTTMAMYEHTKRVSLNRNKYFEGRAGYFIALSSVPVGVAIGLLAAAGVIIAKYDFFRGIYKSIGSVPFLCLSGVCVVIIAAVYILAAVRILKRRYENMRGSYVKYRLYGRELSKIKDGD